MFATRKFTTAARMMHSSNVDELMEAFADQAAPVPRQSALPAAEPVIEPALSQRSIKATAGSASGAIAAEIFYKTVNKAA